MVDPLGYLDFLKLTACARVVLTDSGGVQEETTVLGIPCLTLRENTERLVTLTEGADPSRHRFRLHARRFRKGDAGDRHAPGSALVGREAAERIDQVLTDFFRP